MVITFRGRARSRRDDLPHEDDRAGWLFLMQHHSLPTRLLDWSEAALVGLYFAALDDSQPGVLWAMNPVGFNYTQGVAQGLVTPGHPEVKKLLAIAFSAEGSSEQVLAVLPPEIDLRAMLQAGRCTIHGSIALLDIEEAQANVRRISVPADAKSRIRQQLRMLGVNRSRLFPDLESLAADIAISTSRLTRRTDARNEDAGIPETCCEVSPVPQGAWARLGSRQPQESATSGYETLVHAVEKPRSSTPHPETLANGLSPA